MIYRTEEETSDRTVTEGRTSKKTGDIRLTDSKVDRDKHMIYRAEELPDGRQNRESRDRKPRSYNGASNGRDLLTGKKQKAHKKGKQNETKKRSQI